jgi:hypothetical protein
MPGSTDAMRPRPDHGAPIEGKKPRKEAAAKKPESKPQRKSA